jgi:CheY-like chemotaxis protein
LPKTILHARTEGTGVKTVLVVDDELANAEILSLIFEEEGYRVFCAVNGRHGLERAHEVRPDLIVLDYMMPIMTGAELGRALRADPRTRHIRILMNSSLPEAAIRPHFSGYDRFLRKPYNVEAALAIMSELLAD